MYLWKCWRESRLFFVLSAALFVVFGALTIETGALHDLNPHHFGVLVSLAALLIVACAVTWYFGQTGLGRHFHQNAGDFLFTRPRSRRYFVWSEWSFGMLSAVVLTAVLATWFLIGGHMPMVRVTHTVMTGGTTHTVQTTTAAAMLGIPMFPMVLLTGLSILLFAGLLTGLAQFFSLLFRNGGYGLAAGLATLIVYGWANMLLVKYRDIHLPNPFFVSFHLYGHAMTLAPHFAVELLARTALILAFPLLTQLWLERVDI
ncbi:MULTISPECIES: hypothetical protein [Acidobacterium]|uniref:Putative ABC transporter, permease protein n=1 Tax=Acidobacterium capsulatum (strain ATCC 51196 / DSM 11244 / BCRC 80197 / JCM 7670 / NBRC 15755 / NCIMB 13165 / 161) TaxID=240015 RepID=C1F1V4_ACIC5|nr:MULTISPECIES: hypothetical protein [Acidobacterium]ACO32498.1 putative ABC transporter, permease protein [Acidobacterium capsulatum ATCC 51196]HCT61232.1 hypothetical protein [Acidobacterium sp.]